MTVRFMLLHVSEICSFYSCVIFHYRNIPRFIFHSPVGRHLGYLDKATRTFLVQVFCVRSHLTVSGMPVFPVYEWGLLKETLPDKALHLLWVSA